MRREFDVSQMETKTLEFGLRQTDAPTTKLPALGQARESRTFVR